MHTITCKLMKSVINFTISMEEGERKQKLEEEDKEKERENSIL